MPNMVGFSDDCFLAGLRELTSRVHQYDCKIAAQLNHSGKVSQEDTIAGRPILVPSIPGKSRNDMMPLLTRQELGNFIKMGGPDGKGPRYHLMDQSDIVPVLKGFKFRLSETGLMVMNPPLVKFGVEKVSEETEEE